MPTTVSHYGPYGLQMFHRKALFTVQIMNILLNEIKGARLRRLSHSTTLSNVVETSQYKKSEYTTGRSLQLLQAWDTVFISLKT